MTKGILRGSVTGGFVIGCVVGFVVGCVVGRVVGCVVGGLVGGLVTGALSSVEVRTTKWLIKPKFLMHTTYIHNSI